MALVGFTVARKKFAFGVRSASPTVFPLHFLYTTKIQPYEPPPQLVPPHGNLRILAALSIPLFTFWERLKFPIVSKLETQHQLLAYQADRLDRRLWAEGEAAEDLRISIKQVMKQRKKREEALLAQKAKKLEQEMKAAEEEAQVLAKATHMYMCQAKAEEEAAKAARLAAEEEEARLALEEETQNENFKKALEMEEISRRKLMQEELERLRKEVEAAQAMVVVAANKKNQFMNKPPEFRKEPEEEIEEEKEEYEYEYDKNSNIIRRKKKGKEQVKGQDKSSEKPSEEPSDNSDENPEEESADNTAGEESQGKGEEEKVSNVGFEEKMSVDEALNILGLDQSDAQDPKKLQAAHRRVILRNHPDRGGSQYFAIKINEAKELLSAQKMDPNVKKQREEERRKAEEEVAGQSKNKEKVKRESEEKVTGDEKEVPSEKKEQAAPGDAKQSANKSDRSKPTRPSKKHLW
eukprot:TRINITY_DN762_c0_g1_i7.p1 TRINITY_DN762_c0_g1~~TRINITY_DN762_c0_g1_i7.p1  ORF type:complete len:464 (-),score=168.52 TRINITY_DN762_c0_g1_i7:102-1493(-)